MTDLTDTTLLAFVDGELDPASAAEIAQHLARDRGAAETVRRLQSSSALVRAAFAEQEWQEVPRRLVALVEGRRVGLWLASRRQFASALAASVAACAAGFAGGVALERTLAKREGPAERLLGEVAGYHTVYAGETIPLDLAPASEAPRIEAWFADVLRRPVQIPDLARFGLVFQGARLLVADARPVAQLLYAAPGAPSRPLGVCITVWSGADRALETDRRDGVALALWARRGYAYVLVGWINPSRLRRMAVALAPALEKT
ncbi:MAG: hypothetical protein M0002_00715 [Rhodospirillales bacterium]|nr:hypothetical protein [Rhodospirillales bacterium]